MKKQNLICTIPILMALVFLIGCSSGREKVTDPASSPSPDCAHQILVDAGVPATCTETGLTEGRHCAVCGEVLVKQETIAAKGHNLGEWVEDPAPSCTEQGKKREAAEIAATLKLVSLKRSVMNMWRESAFVAA